MKMCLLIAVVAPEETNEMCGGWSEYEPLTEDDKKVFDACMTLLGVKYIPLLVAKQVVNGYNYRFFLHNRNGYAETSMGICQGKYLRTDCR